MSLDCVIYCAFYSILFRGAVFSRTRCITLPCITSKVQQIFKGRSKFFIPCLYLMPQLTMALFANQFWEHKNVENARLLNNWNNTSVSETMQCTHACIVQTKAWFWSRHRQFVNKLTDNHQCEFKSSLDWFTVDLVWQTCKTNVTFTISRRRLQHDTRRPVGLLLSISFTQVCVGLWRCWARCIRLEERIPRTTSYCGLHTRRQ